MLLMWIEADRNRIFRHTSTSLSLLNEVFTKADKGKLDAIKYQTTPKLTYTDLYIITMRFCTLSMVCASLSSEKLVMI